MPAILSSRPSSYNKIISRSFTLYRMSFSQIIILSLFLSAIIFMPRIVFLITGSDFLINISPQDIRQAWLLLIHLISLMFFIGIIWHMHCVIRKKHEPLIEDFAMGFKKMVYAFIAIFIQSCFVIACTMIIFGLQIALLQNNLLFSMHPLGFLLTMIVFFGQLALILYLWTLFLFLIPLIAVENKGIIGSLERSMKLVWHHWWRVFSVQITPWICYAFLLVIIKYALGINIRIFYTPDSVSNLGITFINLILFALFIPWVAALLLIQLNDLEVREKLRK